MPGWGADSKRKILGAGRNYASQVIDEFAGDYELEDMAGLIANVFGKTVTAKKPFSVLITTSWMMPILMTTVSQVNCQDRN